MSCDNNKDLIKNRKGNLAMEYSVLIKPETRHYFSSLCQNYGFIKRTQQCDACFKSV